MEPTLSSETSAFKLQTPGKFPKEHRLYSKHGESLKTTNVISYSFSTATVVNVNAPHSTFAYFVLWGK